jgi:hypothetical protein
VVVETQLPGLLLKFLVFSFELLDSILLECHFLLKESFVSSYLLFELILLCLECEKDSVKSTVEVILVYGIWVLKDGVFGGRGTAETKVWW